MIRQSINQSIMTDNEDLYILAVWTVVSLWNWWLRVLLCFELFERNLTPITTDITIEMQADQKRKRLLQETQHNTALHSGNGNGNLSVPKILLHHQQ
jgi:hypothetical protein